MGELSVSFVGLLAGAGQQFEALRCINRVQQRVAITRHSTAPVGVAVLTGAGPVAFDLNLLMGALACLLATICYGFAGFLARRWLDQQGGLDPRLSAMGSMLGATLFLLPLFGLSLLNQPPADWGGARVWLSLLGLGLVCTAFAYILFFRLLTNIGPVKSMTVTFMTPPFGILWGALFLGEPLSMRN